MAKYPNQRTIIVDKKITERYYAIYDRGGIAFACTYLNGSAFKVWCYLLSNNDGFRIDVSPTHALNEWGIPKETFRDGFRELIEKGFIVDGKIRQTSQKIENEIRLLNMESEIRSDKADVTFYQGENQQSNNTNDNKDITAIVNDSVDNSLHITGDEEEVLESMSSSWLDVVLRKSKWKWRDHVDDKGILTTKSGARVKVIYDDSQ